MDLFTFEDGTDRLSWNVGKELPLHAVSEPRRAQISKKYKFSDNTEHTQYVEIGNEFTMLSLPIIPAYGVVSRIYKETFVTRQN